MNYAKPFCEALRGPKSTPKYRDKLEGVGNKHIALHTFAIVSQSIKERERVGIGKQRHSKLNVMAYYKPTGSEDASSAQDDEDTLWRMNKEDLNLKNSGPDEMKQKEFD